MYDKREIDAFKMDSANYFFFFKVASRFILSSGHRVSAKCRFLHNISVLLNI
jgi:hypothetical protein